MARITQQSSIHTTGTSYENEPIIKSDGASGEVMQWLASTGGSKVTIDEDSANVMSISVPTMTVGSLDIGHGLGGDVQSTAVGTDALDASHSGSIHNTAIGHDALTALNADAADYNTAVGSQSGASVTSGTQNTLIGYGSGVLISVGDNNTGVGQGSLGAAAVDDNTAVGRVRLPHSPEATQLP